MDYGRVPLQYIKTDALALESAFVCIRDIKMWASTAPTVCKVRYYPIWLTGGASQKTGPFTHEK